MEKRNIYERLNSGEAIRLDDPDFAPAVIEMATARKTLHKINNEFHELDELPPLYEELFGETFQEATAIIPPFYIDFGSQFKIGKNVFINHNCTCMTAGGVTIEDGVMIGPQVTLLTTNHDFDDHNVLICKPVHIGKNAWIGARATILPGVTVGENSIVAGGAVVTKDVEANVIVGGNPAKVLKRLKD